MTTIEGIPFAESTSLKVTDAGYGILGPTVDLSHMPPMFPDRARQVLVISSHWSHLHSTGHTFEICPNLVQMLTISALIPFSYSFVIKNRAHWCVMAQYELTDMLRFELDSQLTRIERASVFGQIVDGSWAQMLG